jgi:ATP-binding cassette subfamily B protein
MAGILAVLGASMALRLALPVLLGRFADDALGGATTSAVTAIAAAYVAAALGSAALDLVVVWWSARVSWRAGNRLRERLAAHALRLEQAWHGRHSPGQLIERIDGDVEAMAIFFAGMAVQIAGNVALILGMLVVATVIDVWTGVVLTVTACAGAAVMVRLRMAAVEAREREREVNAQLYGDLEERLGGLEDLRANGAGRYAVHRLHGHSARSWRAARHASLRGDGSYAASAVVFAVGTAATLVTGIVLQQRGVITIGAVLTLYRYADMLRRPLEQIAEQLKEFQKAMAGARRASTLLATEPRVADGPDDGSSLPAGPLAVDLDDVTFCYDPDDAEAIPALRGVDLHVPAGAHLGLVGRTGSGKTTIGRLLARIWDVAPGSGTVRVGGTDVRALTLDALRDRVAVVTQDVELFRASVRDNLTLFGRRAATDDGLRAVLGEVGLGAWVDALPDGLDTRLSGSHGLSAGEGQLLAFARAFLAEPSVVVLDEASSRLDPVTERRITRATERLLAGRTAVVIAHRLDTLDRVDQIAVLDRGRVVEHGPRAALAAAPASRYARLRRTARVADTPATADDATGPDLPEEVVA